MEISGVVFKVLPITTGASARGEWKKIDVVIETPGQYPTKSVVEFWGDKAEMVESKLTEGMEITAHINIDAKEYNGRWFNSIRGWKFDVKEGGSNGGFVAPATTTTAPPPPPQVNPAPTDDLPF